MNGLNGLTYMDIKQLGTAGQSAVDNRRTDKLDNPATTRQPAEAPRTQRQPPELEVSPEAKAVGKALAQVASLPDVDLAKVERIKAAIEQGRYSVSADRIAEKMLRFEDNLKDNA